MKSIHDDIKRALDDVAEKPEPFDGDPDDLIDMAVAEMGRRLKSEPHELGETALVNLVKEANKAAERRAEERRREESQRAETSVLDVVRRSGLPAERKRELIENELVRLDRVRAELEAELDE